MSTPSQSFRIGQTTSGDHYRVPFHTADNMPQAPWDGMLIWRRDALQLNVYNAQEGAWLVTGAEGGNQVYVGPDEPAADNVGDLWINTSEGNAMYWWDGSEWLRYTDPRLQDIQDDAADALEQALAALALAETQVDVFYQQFAPDGAKENDLWFRDTDNRAFIFQDGEWVEIQDQAIVDALNTAGEAVAIADGKISTYSSSTPPEDPGVGDLWYDQSDSNIVKRWDGQQWQPLRDQGIDEAMAEAVASFKRAKDYVQSRGTNLVTNGTGLLGDNTNFPNSTFVRNDAPTGAAGSFEYNYSGAPLSDEFMPVDPEKVYEYTFWARQVQESTSSTVARMYGVLAPFDAYDMNISPSHYMELSGTRTTLAQPLNPGDTVVHLTDASQWRNSVGASSHFRRIIFWDYVDPGGKLWAPGTYSRNVTAADMWSDGSIVDNAITLRAPWPTSMGAKPAGIVVGQGGSGGGYMYFPSNQIIPGEWTQYTGRTERGVHTNLGASATTRFPAATAKIKIGWLTNYPSSSSGGIQRFAGVSLTEVTAGQQVQDQIDNEIVPDIETALDEAANSIITNARLVPGTLTTWPFQNGSVPAGSFQPGAVGAGDIADFAIAARKLNIGKHILY